MSLDQNLFPAHPVWNDLVNALLIFAVVWAVSRIVRMIFSLTERRLTDRTRTELDNALLRAVKGPVGIAVWILGLKWAVASLNPVAWRLFSGDPDTLLSAWDRVTDGIFFVLLALVVTSLVIRSFNALAAWYANRIAVRTESQIDDELVPLVRRVFQIVAWAVAVIIAFDHFGIPVDALVVSLGAGSLAFALAAQETLSNMIGGFVLFVDRPFRIGDRVRLENGVTGDVLEIGLRSTKILTFDNTVMVVPNAQIGKEKVTNLSYPDPKIRVVVEFGVAYISEVETVRAAALAVARAHPKVLEEPEPQVDLLAFGDSALQMRLVARVADYTDQWNTTVELRQELLQAFRAGGIEIPFPQRDLWLRSPGAVLGAPAPQGVR